MKVENENRKRIAVIGLLRDEMPIFARWEPTIKQMMERLWLIMFHRALQNDEPEHGPHFMVAMDMYFGMHAIECYSDLTGKFYSICGDITMDMATVRGFGLEKGNRRRKQKYAEMQRSLPEKRFANYRQQHKYLIDLCDEVIIATDEVSQYKKKLIERAEMLGKEITLIRPSDKNVYLCCSESQPLVVLNWFDSKAAKSKT